MSISPTIKGWCPGAYRPMMSGDGLVVRIRPVLAQFDADVLCKICDLAETYGNGILELTNRANLQLRGVTEDRLAALLDALGALDVLDADPALESRRNILTQPFWAMGDETETLSAQLRHRLAELPALPAKFGFAVDTGPAPLLSTCSADIRLERGAGDGLILRADGADTGCAVTRETAIDQLIALAHWFADTAPDTTKRMAKLLATMGLPPQWRGTPPVPAPRPLTPNVATHAQQVALPFGQIQASDLREILSGSTTIRVTPFRILILDAPAPITHPAIITAPDDPLLRVDACPGAPRCASASVETHMLARNLAPYITGHLHVSGCAKGCARAACADITLVGRDGAFDIVHGGTAQAAPTQTSIPASRIAQTLLTEMT